MWARTRLDIGWSDLAFGIRHCLLPGDRSALQCDIERFWCREDDTMVCFSVRSGFDLALQALDLPPGSEILFSALNIKGMTKIARRHHLVPVPVDLDLDHMAPDLDFLERALTPASRAIVVAPLFGTRIDLGPLLEAAGRHDLYVIEDCAQAFAGREFSGHPDADISMFSFGPIKFATALGGAILRVRDPEMLNRMREIQASYPVQSVGAYAVRLLKFGGLKIVESRFALGAISRLFRMRGLDYEYHITHLGRGVAPLGSAEKIRHQCPAPMLAVLRRRLSRWKLGDLAGRIEAAHTLLELLGDGVVCPATKNAVHHFWVFPILVKDPSEVMYALREAGFDAATLRRSEAVAPPDDRPELDPATAREAMANLVIIPCYQGIPKDELRRQAEVIRRAVDRGTRSVQAGH